MSDMTANYQDRAYWLRGEIKRMAANLRGRFMHQSDRDYCVERLRKMNSELAAIEEILRPQKKKKWLPILVEV